MVTFSAANQIAPVILTYNEGPNIGRTLDSLRWARAVVVVDSGSTDATERIARGFSNVRWHVRPFDTHLAQWSYAVFQTGIESEYVLALDADMQVSTGFSEEAESSFLPGDFDGAVLRFEYGYYGHHLLGSLCPPQLRLFRRSRVKITQPHHSQEFSVAGRLYKFQSTLIHDDQKSIERWLSSQFAYQSLIEKILMNGGRKRIRDLLRLSGIMPPLIGALAYVKAGGPLRGAAAARYAYERSVAEGVLTIMLMDSRLKKNGADLKLDNPHSDQE
jgi:glycosyltransferase involved in cell wall biosynthesis